MRYAWNAIRLRLPQGAHSCLPGVFVQFSSIVARLLHNDDMLEGSGDERASGAVSNLGDRVREALRRARCTLASIGVAILSPSSDPAGR